MIPIILAIIFGLNLKFKMGTVMNIINTSTIFIWVMLFLLREPSRLCKHGAFTWFCAVRTGYTILLRMLSVHPCLSLGSCSNSALHPKDGCWILPKNSGHCYFEINMDVIITPCFVLMILICM